MRIDLARVNAIQLSLSGVTNIWTAGECTFCNADRYFSFRRQREQAGRMTSFIGTPNPETAH
jgi:copper oxidase (laccase) domain-containing protein